jgi:hypothetical protein
VHAAIVNANQHITNIETTLTGFSKEKQVKTTTDNLQDQIGTGFDKNTTVTSVTNNLQAQIGTGFDKNTTVKSEIGRIDGTIGPKYDSTTGVGYDKDHTVHAAILKNANDITAHIQEVNQLR